MDVTMGAAVCVCQCVCEEETGTRWPWKLMVRWDRVRPTNSKPSWRAPSTSATSSGLGPWYLRAPGHVAEWRARLWPNGILFSDWTRALRGTCGRGRATSLQLDVSGRDARVAAICSPNGWLLLVNSHCS